MERHEALKLHLGQELYMLNIDNEVEQIYVTHLVYRGEEIRIICASSMENWEDTCVKYFQDVFVSKEKAMTVFRNRLVAERNSLQCKIGQINASLEAP